MGKQKSRKDAFDILLSRKIGLIDYSTSRKSLTDQFRHAGLKNFTFFDSKKSDLSAFLNSQEFFIVVAGFERKKLPKVNQTFIKNKKNYLLLQFDDVGGTLGPVLGLEGGPCYECWRQLTRAPVTAKTQVSPISRFEKTLAEVIPKTLISFMTIELIKLMTLNYRPQTYDGFYEVDLLNLQTQFVKLGPFPGCQVCRSKK